MLGGGGSNCLGDNSLGVIARGTIILGENCPGDNCPRWQLSGGQLFGDNCPGGSCPVPTKGMIITKTENESQINYRRVKDELQRICSLVVLSIHKSHTIEDKSRTSHTRIIKG